VRDQVVEIFVLWLLDGVIYVCATICGRCLKLVKTVYV